MSLGSLQTLYSEKAMNFVKQGVLSDYLRCHRKIIQCNVKNYADTLYIDNNGYFTFITTYAINQEATLDGKVLDFHGGPGCYKSSCTSVHTSTLIFWVVWITLSIIL